MNLMLSRRQVIKTGIAGMVSGYCSRRAAEANTTQLDMKQFCAAESSETYELTAPWTSSGYRYATDRAICVRAISFEADSPLPESGLSYPPVSDLPWHEFSRVAHWEPWPKRPKEGSCDFPGFAVNVGAALVKPCYAELVSQLPNIRYALARETSLGEVILLRFQGGEGLLMTMKAKCPSDTAGEHDLKPQRSSVEDEC